MLRRLLPVTLAFSLCCGALPAIAAPSPGAVEPLAAYDPALLGMPVPLMLAARAGADAATPDAAATDAPAPGPDMSQYGQRVGQLQLHQAFGLATLASMAVTAGLGYWYADLGGSSLVLDSHLLFVGLTTGLYLTSATLALTAPPRPIAVPNDNFWDTSNIHRNLAWLHMAGMLGTVSFGVLTDFAGSQFLPYHAVAAYSTLSLMALSAAVIAFGE